MTRGLKISQSITDRQDASLGLYFRDVSKLSLLSQDNEEEITYRAKEGDKDAINKLITSNLRFVISVAKQYQGKGMPLVDLIQAGNLGLISAVEKYDPTRGIKFITFAVWWIRQAVIKALFDYSRIVRIPTNQISYIGKIKKAKEDFEQEHGRTPSVEELKEITHLDEEKVIASLMASGKSVSLDTPYKDEEDCCLIDIIPNENVEPTDLQASNRDLVEGISEILIKLPSRDSDVIRLTYGIGTTALPIDEIAKRFGVGAERIRQIQRDSIKYLRKHYAQEFKELL